MIILSINVVLYCIAYALFRTSLTGKQTNAASLLGFNQKEWDDAGDSGSDSDDISTQSSKSTGSTVDDYNSPNGRICAACKQCTALHCMLKQSSPQSSPPEPITKACARV